MWGTTSRAVRTARLLGELSFQCLAHAMQPFTEHGRVHTHADPEMIRLLEEAAGHRAGIVLRAQARQEVVCISGAQPQECRGAERSPWRGYGRMSIQELAQ